MYKLMITLFFLTVSVLTACQKNTEELVQITEPPDKQLEPDKSESISLPGGEKLKVPLVASGGPGDRPVQANKESADNVIDGFRKIDQCIKSQCGNAGEFANFSFDEDRRFRDFIKGIVSKDDLYKEDSERLNQYTQEFKKDLQFEDLKIKRKLELIDADVKLNNTEMAELHEIAMKSFYMTRVMQEIGALGKTIYDIAPDDKDKILSKFSEAEKSIAKSAVEVFFRDDLRKYTTIEEFIQKKYPDVSFENGLKSYAKKSEAEIMKFKNSMSIFKSMDFNQTQLEKDIESKIINLIPLTPAEKIFVFEAFSARETSMILVSFVLTESDSASQIMQVDLSAVKKSADARMQVLKSITDSNHTEVAISIVWILRNLSMPDYKPETLEKFKTIVETVRESAKMAAKDQLPLKHHRGVENIIDSARVHVESLNEKKDALMLHLLNVSQRREMDF